MKSYNKKSSSPKGISIRPDGSVIREGVSLAPVLLLAFLILILFMSIRIGSLKVEILQKDVRIEKLELVNSANKEVNDKLIEDYSKSVEQIVLLKNAHEDLVTKYQELNTRLNFLLEDSESQEE